jgi:hypothetical protein
MFYQCPVCAYPELESPPIDYTICPSCGTEFEYHDARRTHHELRKIWIREGMHWHSTVDLPHRGWTGWMQLLKAGGEFSADLPKIPIVSVTLQANASISCRELPGRVDYNIRAFSPSFA